MSKKGERRTTSIQVSRPLDLIITNYAAKHNITKSDAADRIFAFLYPNGQIPGTSIPIAPGETPLEPAGAENGADEAQQEEIEVEAEQPEDVSEELAKSVKDLRTVRTIRALSKDIDEEEEEWHLTPKEAYEMKKLETMFGGGGSKKGVDIEGLLKQHGDTLLAQMKSMMAEKDTKDARAEAAYYKQQLDEKKAAETRAAEMAAVVGPLQEQMNQFAEQLAQIGKRLQPESTTPPTSAELEALKSLGTDIKAALVELGKKTGGKPAEELTTYIDGLSAIMDKIAEFTKKGGGEEVFDWKAAGISAFSEVTKEALTTYREIATRKREGEGTEEEAPPLSTDIIEKRVYNYAMKKIAKGELSIDPYKAAEELALTPNQVWAAIQSLQKKGVLRAPKGASEGGTEKTETSTEKTGEELVEGA